MKKLALLTIALFSVGALTASAAGVTVTVGNGPTAADIAIPDDLNFGGGPVSWGNYTWTSTNLYSGGGSVFGYTGGLGFGSNGSWDSAVGPAISLNDSTDDYGVTDSMTIAFKNPVTAFADLFNYAPESPTTPTTISVYGVGGNLLDSYVLNFSTNGATDSGEWLGFASTTPIGYFTMSDNYISMADSPAPEPSSLTYLLLVGGICGGATFFARRKASASPKAV